MLLVIRNAYIFLFKYVYTMWILCICKIGYTCILIYRLTVMIQSKGILLTYVHTAPKNPKRRNTIDYVMYGLQVCLWFCVYYMWKLCFLSYWRKIDYVFILTYKCRG